MVKQKNIKYMTGVSVMVCVAISVGIFRHVRHKEPIHLATRGVVDAEVLYEELSDCDMIEVIKENVRDYNKTLYESRDKEEVTRVIDSIIINTAGIKRGPMVMPLYYIKFYKGGKETITLEVYDSSLRWERGSWEWGNCDFLLTDESYHKLVSWFCEKTGEPAWSYPEYPGMRDE